MARQARVLRDQPGHPQALRQHLIDATQRLLAAHGVTGLTTRTIAHEAQVADGVLYNHFAGKDDLVVVAMVERFTELGRQFSAGCPKPGAQDLRTGLTVLVQQCRTFQADAFPMLAGLLGRPDLLHELFTRLHGAGGRTHPVVWSDIVDFVEAEQRLGTVSPDVSPDTIATVMFGASQMDALREPLTWGATPTAAETATSDGGSQESVERLVDVLVRACRAD